MKIFQNYNIPTIIKSIKLMGKGNKMFLLCIVLFCAVELGEIPLITYGIKGVINGVELRDRSLFMASFMLILMKHLIWSIYSPISSYLCSYASKSAIRDIKVRVIEHIINLPQRYHDSKAKGEILSIVTNDISCLQNIYDWSFFQVIRSALQGIGGIIMMVIIYWPFAIVVFFLGTINVYTTAYFSKKLEKTGEKLHKNISKNNINLHELIKAMKTIRLLDITENKNEEFKYSTSEEEKIRINGGKVLSIMKSILTGLNSISYISILFIGAIFVYYDFSDWGTIIALTGLKISTDCLFSECGAFVAEMQVNIAGVKRLIDILNEEEENIHYINNFVIGNKSIPLKVDNLSFSYDGERNILSNINISLEYKRLTALIGESGCGKSTLMKILLGLYEPKSGEVYFEGNEEVSAQSIRGKTSYVSQEPMLFSGSILQNITLGYDDIEINRAINAAKDANAHKFIEELPNGYDTIISEDGKNLSGGQKQRIAIARALYNDAPILLFDEITSALDGKAEKEIMKTICDISKRKAVLMISHKTNIESYADVVIRL